MNALFEPATLSELPEFRCGHAHDTVAATGCTAIVCPEGAVCSVDVRGGGPATRETDLLRPENMIQAVHAVVLSGGSAFGLEASCGVMDELSARGIGFRLGEACVPIVCGACLFDLLVGQNAHPDKAMGAAATRAALEGDTTLAEGNVGAGCGATVGKLLGPERTMKSGFGVQALKMGNVVVAALVAVNALGNVRDSHGHWIAGCLDDGGRVMDPLAALACMPSATQSDQNASAEAEPAAAPCTNTTIGAVLTNAQLTKAQCQKVASVTHDAYARAIKPVHSQNDGDAIFALASGKVAADQDLVSVMAAEAMQMAIERAVLQATGAYGLKAACDIASQA